MTWPAWVFLIGAVAVGAWVQYRIHKEIRGPSNCMGCGKCDKTGVCVLTGEPVGPRRKE